MRLMSITLFMLCALLLSAYAQNASAENKTEPSEISAPYVSNHHSFYIEMINENQVILENKKASLGELEDYLKDNLSELQDRSIILYITDTQYVNQAYRLGFDLNRVIGKHIWVTYKPAYGAN